MIRIAVTSRAIEAVAEALSLGFILYESEATAGASESVSAIASKAST